MFLERSNHIISLVKKLVNRLKKRKTQPHPNLVIVSRDQHTISRTNISKHALSVLNRLHQGGCQAYLVGGSVRDLLLGLKPKDFDIATDAHPEKIRRLFRNCRLIGRRFRLAHVFFGREIIEVATFRANHPEAAHPEGRQSETGMLVRDNIYGTLAEDAWRRDFSVNALYYNIADFSVVDYTGGMKDLAARVIRMIGDPVARYQEDPVRMLRAIRFAAKLNFTIEEETAKPLYELHGLIKHVSTARLFDEIVKIFYCGHAGNALQLLRHYGLFSMLFPQTEVALTTNTSQLPLFANLIERSCKNTDERIAKELSLNPAFLFAALLWPPLQQQIKHNLENSHKARAALEMAMRTVIQHQIKEVAIPKRFTLMVQEIWTLQHSLQRRTKKSIPIILAHPRFRAAYDFLLLRQESGETGLKSVMEWWRKIQSVSPEKRQEMISKLNSPRKKT